MPIREYECQECQHLFEVVELSAATVTVCDSCGSDRLDRQLSSFASLPARSAPQTSCGPCGCAPSEACTWEN